MELRITNEKKHAINKGMFGLFFEDINYAADGGLYAEMIENRSFEFRDCYGKMGDFYAKHDPGYGWNATKDKGVGRLDFVEGSPVCSRNPHYLRFTALKPNQGFVNKAYNGIYMTAYQKYKVSFYARMASYLEGSIRVQIRDGGKVAVEEKVTCAHVPEGEWQKWYYYEVVLTHTKDIEAGEFVITLDEAGSVDFDMISMFPEDAVAGVFRKDLFEAVKEVHPGFIRFPGGCIVEGNNLMNRYRWKDTVGEPLRRKWNYSRWAVHETTEKKGWHTQFAHYNQSYGLGFYEYFLLCELIGAKALPVLNVGLACQFQSYELVAIDSPEFDQYIQDALDLIEFANGSTVTKWGALRAAMGHPDSFELEMIGIGNEQWETDHVDFYARYERFEKAIHQVYPGIKLIGSAGPDVNSEKYESAWAFYHNGMKENRKMTFAVDEHYYMKPEWFLENSTFYDEYPRDINVFAGEYAAHPDFGKSKKHKNTVDGALAEAAFLTGVERNADVVVMASYAPLFARIGYTQWAPDMIWFDDKQVYLSPSYHVQKLFSENMGTYTIELSGQEKELREKKMYVAVSYDAGTGEYIVKIVNCSNKAQLLDLILPEDIADETTAFAKQLTAAAKIGTKYPQESKVEEIELDLSEKIKLPGKSFTVIRL